MLDRANDFLGGAFFTLLFLHWRGPGDFDIALFGITGLLIALWLGRGWVQRRDASLRDPRPARESEDMSRSRKALQLALLLLGTWLFYLAVTQEPATPRLPAPSASPLPYIGLWSGPSPLSSRLTGSDDPAGRAAGSRFAAGHALSGPLPLPLATG